jgi:hypothetical protein
MLDRTCERSTKRFQGARSRRKFAVVSHGNEHVDDVAIQVLEVCLDRFREKKTNVIDALRETCEAAYPGVRSYDEQ